MRVLAVWMGRRRALTLIPVFALLGACAQEPVLGPEVQPEIISIERYEYPYDGLKVEIDPKSYTEYVYEIQAVRSYSKAYRAGNKTWAPVQRDLVLKFSPKAFRKWVLLLGFKRPDGEVSKVVSKEFEVDLPPWHHDKTAAPIDFTVKVKETCLYSKKKRMMQKVRTVIGYTMQITHLPRDLDRDRYVGFSSTVPKITYSWDGTDHVVEGWGGGIHADLDKPMNFAGNYDLKRDPYPSCDQLSGLRVSDWGTAQIRLLDKYLFPVPYTVGTVEQEDASALGQSASTGG